VRTVSGRRQFPLKSLQALSEMMWGPQRFSFSRLPNCPVGQWILRNLLLKRLTTCKARQNPDSRKTYQQESSMNLLRVETRNSITKYQESLLARARPTKHILFLAIVALNYSVRCFSFSSISAAWTLSSTFLRSSASPNVKLQ
jgi:hypothetical protein